MSSFGAGGRLGAAVVLLLGLLVSGSVAATPAGATACPSTATHPATRLGSIRGIVRPKSVGRCLRTAAAAAPSYPGTPPLVDHGGPVMATPSGGNQVVVTPIFWAGAGYSFTASYQNTIDTYLADLASDSGRTTNVFATTWEYSGRNGPINYRMTVGTPIIDTAAVPTAGCAVDSGAIYADNSGYTTCLDDDQVSSEVDSVVSAQGLTRDYGHLYVLFLPQHVESCFYPGTDTVDAQQCTINASPTSAYCAYHSAFNRTGETVYATMPFPIYRSNTGSSCTDENLGGDGKVQSPTGDVDADVEISPLSHELAEAITDPDGDAWYDSSGYENGDECAYVYGAVSGPSGGLYNQSVNGHHYLTQEEFSNAAYVAGLDACRPGIDPAVPTVSALSVSSGKAGATVTVTGTGFPGATAVRFGTTAAAFSLIDATHLTATAPAGPTGAVDVKVSTAAGTSPAAAADRFAYPPPPPPAVGAVSPRSGPTAAGHYVTITGTNFRPGATVTFGAGAATSVTVASSTRITARAPGHSAGRVDVRVTTTGGRSPATTSDRYTFLARPVVRRISPTSGAHAGWTFVTITGSGFVRGATVRFGSLAGRSVRVVSSTRITVRSPRHARGRVDVRVSTPGGTSLIRRADHFTYR